MANIKISTSLGDITVRLYDDTPIHRDNFLKLASEGYYDGTLFHRVIRDFMIQGGDPDSKGAPAGKQLGVGGPDYTLQAEIKPHLFHKRGALCAARLGDEVNPNRESSGSQFYIVWGSVYNPSQLKQMEKQMKQNQVAVTFNDLVSYHKEEIMNMRRNRDRAGLQAMQEQLLKEAEGKIYKPLRDKLTAALQRVAKEKGLAFILNTDNDAVPFINPTTGFNVQADVNAALQ